MSWICKICEAENPETVDVCEVCDSHREIIIANKLQGTICEDFTPNDYEHIIWYNKAASYEKDINNYLYVMSKYDKRTYKEVMKFAPYLLISADKGDQESQFKLGDLFVSHWRPECRANAFIWFSRSAIQGNNEAMEKLAFCYEYGIGTGKDLFEARKWYERAINNGCEIAKQGLKRIQAI